MKDWAQRNIWNIITQLVLIGLVSMLALWFRVAVANQLEGYVTQREWVECNVRLTNNLEERNRIVDKRMDEQADMLKAVSMETIIYREKVLEKLTRIEERQDQVRALLGVGKAKGTP